MRLVAAALLALTVTSSARAEDIVWKDEWRDPVDWPEGIAAGTLVLGNLAVGLLWEPPSGTGTGGILFDDAAVEVFSGRSNDLRNFAQATSNWLWYGLELYPLVVDVGIVSLGVRQDPKLALRLGVISFNSLALTSLMTQTAHHVIRRDRPFRKDCLGGDDDPRTCATGNRYASFWSGHTAFAFTGAGLVCAHQRKMNLYGSRTVGAVACATTMTLATATGIFRMVNDKHYATDILAAVGVGILNGYLLPTWIYYSGDPKDPEKVSMRIAPLLGDDVMGLSFGGMW